MNYQLIKDFLTAVAANNNRPWFQNIKMNTKPQSQISRAG